MPDRSEQRRTGGGNVYKHFATVGKTMNASHAAQVLHATRTTRFAAAVVWRILEAISDIVKRLFPVLHRQEQKLSD